MPTTYTHDYFGKTIYKKLTAEQKAVLRRNKDLFRIGLHGPDILFYYMISVNPVTQFGVKMHRESAKGFFVQGAHQVLETGDEELQAYLMGFACHYILDSTCHPYVNQIAEEGICTHTLLEKEFDRYLMHRSGKDPLTYHPSDAVVARYHYARVIHRALPLVKTFNIFLSLHMMKLFTNLMVHHNMEKKRKLIHGAMHVIGPKRAHSMIEFFMKKHPTPGINDQLVTLQRLFDQAADKTPDMMNELWDAMQGQGVLSENWTQTYNG